MLSLPISNAEVERALSIVNIVEDKVRNKISIDAVDGILRIRFNLGSNCHNFVPTQNLLMEFNSAAVYVTDLSSDNEKTHEIISE